MPQNTMKAARLHAHGGPEVLRYEDAPVPELKAGEVLVRVRAAGINPPDWYVRGGMTTMPGERTPSFAFPMTPGTDVSGVVVAVAGDTDAFAVGDEVFGMVRFPSFRGGGYAEYVSAPASHLALKPASVDHVHAAAVPMAGLTAWQFLIDPGHDVPSPFQAAPHRPVALETGMTVLVNGAAGGVGHLALQLAKWKGARVIAVASGAHEPFLRDLGADEFIDYTTHSPEQTARDVDVVLDCVGNALLMTTVKRGGALFQVYPAAIDPQEADRLGVTVSSAQVRSSGEQIAELGRLLEKDVIRVAIDSTYPLEQVQEAHERAARGHLRGKLVLNVSQP